jgi:hypothetical protein
MAVLAGSALSRKNYVRAWPLARRELTYNKNRQFDKTSYHGKKTFSLLELQPIVPYVKRLSLTFSQLFSSMTHHVQMMHRDA